MKKITTVLFLFSLYTGCDAEKEIADKPYVVTTTMMIYDAANYIIGDSARVEYIMGSGVDPHVYKATQGDLTKIDQADLILYNGLHLEGKMGEILKQAGRSKPVLAIAERIDSSRLHIVLDDATLYDPHIWFDVDLWKEAIEQMAIEFTTEYPDWKELINKKAQRYVYSLDTLHQWVVNEMNTIPESQRVLITAHDAFGYFGGAYNLEVRGLQGISTQAEYGLRDVTDMVDFIVENNIKAVFVEASISSRSIEAVVEGCKRKGHQVSIGGTLYTDSMGEPGSPGETYHGVVAYNTQTIKKALQ